MGPLRIMRLLTHIYAPAVSCSSMIKERQNHCINIDIKIANRWKEDVELWRLVHAKQYKSI
ncbi:hypothetical protein ACTXT7_006143 [Hymenolepis weldensis]